MYIYVIFGVEHAIIQDLDFPLLLLGKPSSIHSFKTLLYLIGILLTFPHQLIQKLQNSLTFLQFMKKCNMSSSSSQTLQKALFFILIVCSHLLQGIILWVILNWNDWIFVSLVVENGRLKILFQKLLSDSMLRNSFVQAFLHLGLCWYFSIKCR